MTDFHSSDLQVGGEGEDCDHGAALGDIPPEVVFDEQGHRGVGADRVPQALDRLGDGVRQAASHPLRGAYFVCFDF